MAQSPAPSYDRIKHMLSAPSTSMRRSSIVDDAHADRRLSNSMMIRVTSPLNMSMPLSPQAASTSSSSVASSHNVSHRQHDNANDHWHRDRPQSSSSASATMYQSPRHHQQPRRRKLRPSTAPIGRSTGGKHVHDESDDERRLVRHQAPRMNEIDTNDNTALVPSTASVSFASSSSSTSNPFAIVGPALTSFDLLRCRVVHRTYSASRRSRCPTNATFVNTIRTSAQVGPGSYHGDDSGVGASTVRRNNASSFDCATSRDGEVGSRSAHDADGSTASMIRAIRRAPPASFMSSTSSTLRDILAPTKRPGIRGPLLSAKFAFNHANHAREEMMKAELNLRLAIPTAPVAHPMMPKSIFSMRNGLMRGASISRSGLGQRSVQVERTGQTLSQSQRPNWALFQQFVPTSVRGPRATFTPPVEFEPSEIDEDGRPRHCQVAIRERNKITKQRMKAQKENEEKAAAAVLKLAMAEVTEGAENDNDQDSAATSPSNGAAVRASSLPSSSSVLQPSSSASSHVSSYPSTYASPPLKLQRNFVASNRLSQTAPFDFDSPPLSLAAPSVIRARRDAARAFVVDQEEARRVAWEAKDREKGMEEKRAKHMARKKIEQDKKMKQDEYHMQWCVILICHAFTVGTLLPSIVRHRNAVRAAIDIVAAADRIRRDDGDGESEANRRDDYDIATRPKANIENEQREDDGANREHSESDQQRLSERHSECDDGDDNIDQHQQAAMMEFADGDDELMMTTYRDDPNHDNDSIIASYHASRSVSPNHERTS